MIKKLPFSFQQALKGSTVLFAAMMLVNILNYGYALVLGRIFGPAQYGAYASFMSLFLLITLLPMTLQQIGAKYAATGESVINYNLKLAAIIGTTLGVVLVITSKQLSNIINLPYMWLIGLGAVLPFYALLGVLRGEAQGKQAFVSLGSNLVLEHLTKIFLTPFALMIAPMASGAVLATLVALPLTLTSLWRYLKRTALQIISQAEVYSYALPILVNLSAQAIIINSDVLMVNALLPAQDAGIYAAIALIGRVIFYGSWAISAAFFPMVAARHREGKPHQGLLYMALAGVALVSLTVTAGCALFPNLVINLLFGEAYLGGAHLVAPYAIMTTLYALANVVSSHYLALGSHRAGYLPLLGAFAQIIAILFLHDSTLQVIYAQIAAKGSLFILLLLGAYFCWFTKGNKHVIR